MDSTGLGYGQVTGICEHDIEPLGSIKGGKFLEQTRCVSVSRRAVLGVVSYFLFTHSYISDLYSPLLALVAFSV